MSTSLSHPLHRSNKASSNGTNSQSFNASTSSSNFTDDWLYKQSELRDSPSCRDGIPWEEELRLRRKTCLFIDQIGQDLKLPKLTLSTAQVFFQRFYMRQSFKTHDRFVVGSTCLFLAGKVEESPRKLGDVVKAYFWARKEVKLDGTEDEYTKTRAKIVATERVLLHTIAFDLVIEHPYRFIFDKVKLVISVERLNSSSDRETIERDLAQTTWNFLNDSMRTILCLQYPAETIAAAAVYLSVVYFRIIPPSVTVSGGKPWWTCLDVPEYVLNDIGKQLMELYQANADHLPDRLSRLLHSYPTAKNIPPTLQQLSQSRP